MKKKTIVSLLILSLILLMGCTKSEIPEIHEYGWFMTTVQSMDHDGQAIAYGQNGSSTLDDAVMLDIVCEADNGILTLTDNTNGKCYTGSYKTYERNQSTIIYEVRMDGISGIATSALTVYADGSSMPTLIISIGDYTLNFFAESTYINKG